MGIPSPPRGYGPPVIGRHGSTAIDDLVAFQRLVRASALRIGQVVNQAEIARDVGLPPTTAQRYLGLLDGADPPRTRARVATPQ